ncbi:hypothetical protein TSAR_009297 [Trichomalopsis sarcophagae]|uniref:DNA mismatch repair protein n=1 Tax=Trichomalopsis sarcophagae TaxID=543379 RepID=A0A232FG60_9HYME|nr:hypothetical protein TSAR_009297 [Trichomalopsis sarcophagae]
MPKVNTLFNYFTSPKGASPRSNNSSPAPKPRASKAKSETPKREQKNKDTKRGKGKDKENVRENRERKRSLDDLDDNEEPMETEEAVTPKPTPKRRRIIIPEDNSEDSGDEYKPDESAESEEDLDLSVVSESEPNTASEDEDETPKKKQKMSNIKTPSRRGGGAKKSIAKKDSGTGQEQPAGKASDTQDWPHLKYEFLQKEKIKDNKKRRSTDPDYDPRTVYVPPDFLDKQTPAMRQWWVLKSDHYDCVLFFKVGKFYELYHMDAVTGVNELSLTFMRGEFAHSGFPEIAYGRFSASLIERGYKVARIEQTENPEMMSQRCAKMGKTTKFDKVVKREICQISTKGTRVYTAQDAEASAPMSTYLLSIIEKQERNQNISSYGVCFIDTTIGDFNLGQFQDDRCNSRLLTLLAHYPPAHIIYERNNLSQTTLKILNNLLPGAMKEALQKEVQFWSSTKVLNVLHEADYFKNEEDSSFSWPKGLEPYLNDGDSLGLTPLEEKQLAVNALGGCVYLLKNYQLDHQLLAQRRFKTYVPPDFSVEAEKSDGTKLAYNMVLDAMTITNLRVLGNEGSLIKTLDNCCTAFGKRLLREWVCRPSCRKSVIVERQNAITELIDNPDVVQEVRSKLSGLPDLERLLSKIHVQGNAAKLRNHPDGRAIMFEGPAYSKKTIVDFITALNGFEDILKLIKKFSKFTNPLINKCTRLEPEGDFPELRETLDHFKTAFNHEEAKKEGFIVPKHGVDREYDAVLMELADIKKELDSYLEKQRKYFGVQIKYCGNDKKRYQIEVPESQIKKVGSGYELQGSRKGFKRYYTEETKDLLARQIAAEEQKDKVLKDSNRKIFAKFSDQYDKWSNATYNIAVLDCLISLAEYARTYVTCIPTIFDDTDDQGIFIEIREGKHPCIVSENFIPNDTVIATAKAAPLIILTGPNMGGKSTLMRQVGLITIMAQIGCHVPATDCKLTLVDRIFTRLGANDDIMAGQSTFLVELSETSAILQHATKYSLVLLDELGRGTSTYDGTAIAASVVEALTKIQCRTLFSTHYHSLVEDYKMNKNVTLAHMACMVESDDEDQISEENVTFLYKLSEGACPKSYGFNAARLAGLPASITKRAQSIATKLEAEVNLRHAFTALCKITDSSAVKPLFQKGFEFLSKC